LSITLHGLLAHRLDYTRKFSTYVILCENNIHAGLFKGALPAHLKDRCGEQIVFLPSVVDRLCVGSEIDNGKICVTCEDFAEIVLEADSSIKAEVEELFRGAPEKTVRLVGDIVPYRARKLVMLNGAHKVLSFLALYQNFAHFDKYVTSDDGEPFLLSFLKEAATIVRHLHGDFFSDEDLGAYADSIAERFRNNPDKVSRLVERFKNPESLPKVLQDFHTKIGSTALQYFHETRNPPGMTASALLALGALLELNRFAPPSRP
jgi:mannitol-1-phosphate/altronate dehydrogenase